MGGKGDGILTAGGMISALRGLRAALGKKQGEEGYDPRYDFNQSGGVAVNDLAALRQLLPLLSEAEQRNLTAFQTIDQDQDYVLTAEEWQAAVTKFTDLLTQGAAKNDDNAAFDLNGDGAINGLDIDPFTKLFDYVSKEEQVRFRLLKIKDQFAGEDGQLSAAEYQEASATFTKLLTQTPSVYVELYDLNGDGAINGLDIDQFNQLASYLSEEEKRKLETAPQVQFLLPAASSIVEAGADLDVRVQLSETETSQLACQQWFLDGRPLTIADWVSGQSPDLRDGPCL